MGAEMMKDEAADEFDAWLQNDPTPKPAPAPVPTSASAFSSWFGGGSSFLDVSSTLLGGGSGGSGSFLDAGSTLLGAATKNLEEGAAFLSSQARDVADSLQKQQLPADSWAALDGVTSKLKATLDDNLQAFNQEASKYCTEDALQRERAEIKQALI